MNIMHTNVGRERASLLGWPVDFPFGSGVSGISQVPDVPEPPAGADVPDDRPLDA